MIESLNTGNSYLKSLEIYVCLIGKCKVCWWYPTKPPVQSNIIKNKATNIIINNIWYNVLFPTEHNFQVIYHKSAFSEKEIIPIVYFVPPAPHLGWWNSICRDFTHSSFSFLYSAFLLLFHSWSEQSAYASATKWPLN